MLKAKLLGFEVVYAKYFTSLDGNALTANSTLLSFAFSPFSLNPNKPLVILL